MQFIKVHGKRFFSKYPVKKPHGINYADVRDSFLRLFILIYLQSNADQPRHKGSKKTLDLNAGSSLLKIIKDEIST